MTIAERRRRRRTTTPVVVVVSSRTRRGWRALHSFFLGGGILRARALYSSTLGRTERIFGETFLCGKTNVIIKAVEKHFEKYNEEYYYDYAED